MSSGLKLMVITAHPDDESLGFGGVLSRYSDEGIETHLLCATGGEGGRHGGGPHPGPEALGRIREGELRAAAGELGLHDVQLLGYVDLALDQAEPAEAVRRVEQHLLRVRPDVVVTFGPEGAYGHPDHVAISQLVTAATVTAAGGEQSTTAGLRHLVKKLYYMAWGPATWAAYQQAFKRLTSTVDGVVREAQPWPEWLITTRVDARAYWPVVWRAVQCHKTQMPGYAALAGQPDETHAVLWGDQTFYRAYSTVNGGRVAETDLFEGLR